MESNRIQELLVELQQCREEQRHNEIIIVQTITTVATVLGILSGVSHLSDGASFNTPLLSQTYSTASAIKRILYLVFSDLTLSRLFFYISCLAFCTTFSFISISGVKATMLYFYIQNIEDRLQSLIHDQKDDIGRNQLVHFDDYYAPISTLNIRHLSSSYSCWHYITVLFTVICAIGCSLGFVLLQFYSIEIHFWHDSFFFLVTIITMGFTLFMYLRTTVNARMIAQYSMDTAHENIKARLDGNPANQYASSSEYMRQVKYLLFPRLREWYKALVVFLGYLSSCYYFGKPFHYTEIALLLVLFEYLMYGARYQINDIRGRDEDLNTGNYRLLTQETKNIKHVIKKSLIVAGVKFCSALILTFIFAWEGRQTLLWGYLVLIIITIIYEIARTFSSNRPNDTSHSAIYDYSVYLSVGTGYPLRFLVGFLVAKKAYSVSNLKPHFVFFLLSVFSLGIFAALLSWRNRIDNIDQQNVAKHMIRIKKASSKGTIASVFAPWNIFYLLSLLLILIAIISSNEADSSTLIVLYYIIGILVISLLPENTSIKVILFLISFSFGLTEFIVSSSLIKIYIGELLVISVVFLFLDQGTQAKKLYTSGISAIKKMIIAAIIGNKDGC